MPSSTESLSIVGWLVCAQDNSQSCGRIMIKFLGQVHFG